MDNLKLKKIYKITVFIMVLIALSVATYMAVAMIGGFQNYFTQHLCIPLVLLAVGVIA